ncbi:hypothetical protein SASPL_116082 [Salvia splendens]|uniref:Uncharacterized protein n=1 Tax=Salvia splendens TaxID=180675 RepID=A0A8X9A1W1_SALSN|nr:hypothetical protein SASPL_116082 [Salvia splendens]
MVSRANVPRTMMSLTPLAEPEKRELEWESRWGQLKLESQQFEARWEKMMQQLRNMIVPKPSEVVAVADKEFNFESLVEEVDLQYEARRQQSEARFHERMADTDPHTFVPLPQVEGQGSVSLESHDGEWIVVLTPWQKTEELELSIPLPHNCNLEKVNDIDSEPYDYFSEIFDTSSSRHGMDSIGGVVEQLSGVVEEESMMLRKDAIVNFEEFGKYSNFSLQFCLDAKAGGGKIDHGQVKKGMELEQNQLQRIEQDVSSLSYGFERKTFTPKDVQVPEQDGKDNRDIFILEIGILVGKKHGGKREEDPLHGDMSFDVSVLMKSLAKELETGESTLRLTHKCLFIIAFDVLMIVLRWIRERSAARLLEASVRSNGQIRPTSEAAGERERVLCLKRLLVVQGQDDLLQLRPKKKIK